MHLNKLKSQDVFGVSNTILVPSYIDRGKLDVLVQRHLERPTHIALRGESKCGKSWFRQKNIPNSIVVQCRFGKSVIDIYTDALSQLGIKLMLEETRGNSIKGRIETQTSLGISVLAKLGLKSAIEADKNNNLKEKPIGQDVNDLKFIADIVINSGKRLVIEDFHYLSVEERKNFSFDLKTLWDYGCFVIIIGVWSQSNLLTYLNADLSGRIVEMSIYWSSDDLRSVIRKGNEALNIQLSSVLESLVIDNCFGNVGILQKLMLLLLDEAAIYEQRETKIALKNRQYFTAAGASYADQLNAIYQQFARTVSAGIRKRKDSTGIYAHAMAVIVSTSDDKLINGLELDEIYQIAHDREPRIKKGNLRTVLNKLEELQVDKDGRGLVIAYNDSTDQVSAVDRQLLFYRKHLTVTWPWETLIAEVNDEILMDENGQMYLF